MSSYSEDVEMRDVEDDEDDEDQVESALDGMYQRMIPRVTVKNPPTYS